MNQLIYSKKGERDKNGVLYYPVEGTAEPYDDLKNAVLNIGFSNMAQDSDGTVRRVIPEETYGNETHYMFSRLLYEEYAKRAGITVEDIPATNKLFEDLMGTGVTARKNYIKEHSEEAVYNAE